MMDVNSDTRCMVLYIYLLDQIITLKDPTTNDRNVIKHIKFPPVIYTIVYCN